MTGRTYDLDVYWAVPAMACGQLAHNHDQRFTSKTHVRRSSLLLTSQAFFAVHYNAN